MSTVNRANNKVVIINESTFDETNDPNWKTHELYNSFIDNLETDYNNELNTRQRTHFSCLSSLNKAKHSYALFQVFLKIISQIGQSVNYFQFEFKANQSNNKIQCIAVIHYSSGFIQRIITMNHPNQKRIQRKQTTSNEPINQTLINAVKHHQKCNNLPVTINGTKVN